MGWALSKKRRWGLCSSWVLTFDQSCCPRTLSSNHLDIWTSQQRDFKKEHEERKGAKEKQKKKRWRFATVLSLHCSFFPWVIFFCRLDLRDRRSFVLSECIWVCHRVYLKRIFRWKGGEWIQFKNADLDGWMITNGWHQRCLLSFSTKGKGGASFLHFYEQTCLAIFDMAVINRAIMDFHWFHMPDPSCRSTVLTTILVTPRYIYSPSNVACLSFFGQVLPLLLHLLKQ